LGTDREPTTLTAIVGGSIIVASVTSHFAWRRAGGAFPKEDPCGFDA
jgi:hypothetical protein